MLRADSWRTDPLLPRAFSLLQVFPNGEVEILVKGTGKAAQLLKRAQVGETFSVLGPLGSRFPKPLRTREDWLVAGGVGLAPLLMQAISAKALGCASKITMYYGGRSKHDLVLQERIRATGVRLVCATEDGSEGSTGFVTEAMTAHLSEMSSKTKRARPTLLVCGPDPMLEAVSKLAYRHDLDAYLSLEGEMACGIGACLVCAVPCKTRPFRYACADGPVFPLAELAGRYEVAGRDQEKGT